MNRSTNMEHVRVLYRMANESWRGSPEFAALTAAIVVLSTPQPAPVAPVGAEGLLADLETIWHSVSDDKETNAAYQRLKSALAQQPAADGGFTAADMMDARLEGRREACPKCDGTGATLMEQAALADQQGGAK